MINSPQSPERGSSRVRFDLFSQVMSNRTNGHGLKLCHGEFRLDIRKNFIIKMVAKHWHRLSREVVVLSTLKVF